MKMRVQVGEQSYEVEIENINARPVMATVEGETFEIWPEESASAPAAAPIAKPVQPRIEPAAPKAAAPAAAAAPTAGGANAVTAPIPGVILTINVKVGDSVKFGQELCVLEAMKMKNAIRATRDGKIGNIAIAVGDHVKHGQTLIEFAG